MEDLFPILVFLFFLLAPLIERILKGGRKGDEQPPPPPRQRVPPPAPAQRRSEPMPDEEEVGSAAEMLPDDLWAILTGETRPSREPPPPLEHRPSPRETTTPQRPNTPERAPRPRPQRPERRPFPNAPRPRPAPEPVSVEAAADEEVLARTPPAPERFERVEYAPQDYVRPIPEHAPPVIVSMETMPDSDEIRHTRFHDRVARLAAPATVQRGPERQLVGLHDREQLRRAIILTEVLGTPKGLQ